jgi:hypothetical protein
LTIGIITRTTGVLFMKAEATIVPAPISATASLGLRRVRRMTQPDTSSSAPVLSNAPDRTNIAAIVIGAGFENTASNSSTDRKPSSSMASAKDTASTTGGSRSIAKATKRITSMASPISGR